MKASYPISFFILAIGLISCLAYLKTEIKNKQLKEKNNTNLITNPSSEYTRK